MNVANWGIEVSMPCILEQNSYIITTRHLSGLSQREAQPQVWMMVGKGVSAKSNKMTWHSEWTTRLWKFFEKSFQAFLSWNRTWRGGRAEEKDLELGKRFWARVDLCYLGAIAQYIHEREREDKKHITNGTIEWKERDTYAWNMHERVTCKNKYIIGKTQSKPTSIYFTF